VTARATTAIRVMMLVVIAVVALANAIGWVDPDLWIPFVCIIAVMGIGTRGGVLDTLGFVLTELAVVLVLGVATFSGSRDFVWAASVGVSVLAVGKIGLLEMSRNERKAPRTRTTSSTATTSGQHRIVREPEPETPGAADDEPVQPLGTLPEGEPRTPDAPPIEPPETPATTSPERPKRKRDRDDPTPVHKAR
jgi:hypothetical protein